MRCHVCRHRPQPQLAAAASLSSWPMEKIETLRPLRVTTRPTLLQKKALVVRNHWIAGYRDFRFTRASAVVNRPSTVPPAALRRLTHAAVSRSLPMTHIGRLDRSVWTLYGAAHVGHGTRAPHLETAGASAPAAGASVPGAAGQPSGRGSSGVSGVSPDRRAGALARAQLPSGIGRSGAHPAGAVASAPPGPGWGCSPAAGRWSSGAVGGASGSGCAARPAPCL